MSLKGLLDLDSEEMANINNYGMKQRSPTERHLDE